MDWIAGIIELMGLWLVGNRRKVGFICNITCCSVWVYVSINKEVYGLLLVVVPALFVNLRNYLRWRRIERGMDEVKR